jgi:transposase InsO family protein
MTSAPDRREMVALVDEAVAAGARQAAACAELDLDARTFQRWKRPDGGVREDRRPVAERPAPANRLTEAERDRIVVTCNTPEFASLPPSQIVPRLADQGKYVASESSFYRVLRERGQNHRRGRARRPRRSQPPTSFKAEAPCQVWSWDITWLPGPVLGMFFYLYLIVDIYSRKIVGWEVHEREGAEFAARLLERAVWAEGCLTSPLTLHADNGSAMKGATMKVTMERLGVIAAGPAFPTTIRSRRRCSGPASMCRHGRRRALLHRRGAPLGGGRRSLVQHRTSPQCHPLRHSRAAPSRRRPGPARQASPRLSGRPRPASRAMVWNDPKLAADRRGLAQPATPRHRVRRSWGRRRAPTKSWRRWPHDRPRPARSMNRPQAATTLTNTESRSTSISRRRCLIDLAMLMAPDHACLARAGCRARMQPGWSRQGWLRGPPNARRFTRRHRLRQ